jgi:tetratricopeptide (TPR) repeat protein
LIATLHEETEGNPLFVGETVRLLALEGRIAIPQSVRDVISRRLAHLGDECNRILVLASVLGREFALDALARLSGVSEDEVLETLDEAMSARVVSDVPGGVGRLRFAHVLIRDTTYEGLTTARRVRLHRLAAEALEGLYGDESGPHLAELAHHAIAGSEFDKGLVVSRRAGDRAFALLAFEEAARLYESALEALDLASLKDERERCRLLLSRGDAEARAGNMDTARVAFVEAAGIARRLSLPHELAQAAAGYGGRIVWARGAEDDRVVPLLEEGLAALSDDDVELRARLLARLAGALRDEPARDRRDALSSEAVDHARRSGNAAALAYALEGRMVAIIAPDTTAERIALATELHGLAHRLGDAERIVGSHLFRFMAELELGDVSAALVDLADAGPIAHDLRQPAHLWGVRGAEAMVALATGKLDDVEELIQQAFALGERARTYMAIPVERIQRYTLSEFRGSLESMVADISDLAAAYPARPVFRCVLAHLCAGTGRRAQAQRVLDDFRADDFASVPFDQEWLFGMSMLAETAASLGDVASADHLYRLLEPWAARNISDPAEVIRGSANRYLGLLATAAGRWAEAAEHFETALAENERMGFRPWLVRTQEDFAHMLRARGEAGDEERAGELEAAAVATCAELGMASHRAAPA